MIAQIYWHFYSTFGVIQLESAQSVWGKKKSTFFNLSVMLVQINGQPFPRGDGNKIAHIYGHNFNIKNHFLGQFQLNPT